MFKHRRAHAARRGVRGEAEHAAMAEGQVEGPGELRQVLFVQPGEGTTRRAEARGGRGRRV